MDHVRIPNRSRTTDLHHDLIQDDVSLRDCWWARFACRRGFKSRKGKAVGGSILVHDVSSPENDNVLVKNDDWTMIMIWIGFDTQEW